MTFMSAKRRHAACTNRWKSMHFKDEFQKIYGRIKTTLRIILRCRFKQIDLGQGTNSKASPRILHSRVRTFGETSNVDIRDSWNVARPR